LGANKLRINPAAAITAPAMVTILHPYRFVRALAIGPENNKKGIHYIYTSV